MKLLVLTSKFLYKPVCVSASFLPNSLLMIIHISSRFFLHSFVSFRSFLCVLCIYSTCFFSLSPSTIKDNLWRPLPIWSLSKQQMAAVSKKDRCQIGSYDIWNWPPKTNPLLIRGPNNGVSEMLSPQTPGAINTRHSHLWPHSCEVTQTSFWKIFSSHTLTSETDCLAMRKPSQSTDHHRAGKQPNKSGENISVSCRRGRLLANHRSN